MTNRTCSQPGCDRTHYAHGYCSMHYKRAWKRGEFRDLPSQKLDITGHKYGLLTAVRPIGKHWECACECGATTYVEAGALNAGYKRSCGNPLLHHRVETPSYRALHTRIATERGKASNYACADCGEPAHEWAYDHSDPDEVTTDGRHQPYSYDINHYQPRCKPCHRRQDAEARGGRDAPVRSPAAPRATVRTRLPSLPNQG